jgi:hypothetical protein
VTAQPVEPSTTAPQAWWARVPGWLWALALYVVLALWRFSGVLRAPTRLIIGGGDAFNYLWRVIWWGGGYRQFSESPWIAPQLTYPSGHYLADAEITALNLFPAVALSKLTGAVFAYNVTVMSSVVLSALVVYAFVRSLKASPPAAALAGVVYGFGAYPMFHAMGHLPLMGMWTLPLGLMVTEFLAGAIADDERRRSVLWSLALGASVGLAAWSSWYYLVMFGIAVATYALVRLSPKRTGLPRRPWALLGLALVVALAMAVPVFLLVRAHQSDVRMVWSTWKVWGAPPFAYLVPSVQNPVFGNLAKASLGHTPYEDSLYVGWAAFLLAVVGVSVYRRKKPGLLGPLLWTAVVGFVLSLGPRLYLGHWYDPKFGIAYHGRIFGRSIVSLSSPTIPLPAVLFQRLPVFVNMRQWDRFGIVVLLCVAVAAALGFDAIRERIKNRPRVAVSVLFAIVLAVTLFETLAVVTVSDTSPKAIDLFLAKQRGSGSVVWLPDWAGVEDEQIYKTTVTGKPIVFGSSTYAPREARVLGSLVQTFPDVKSVAALDKDKVRWVVWQKRLGPTPIMPGAYKVIASFPDVDVLERVHTP